MIFLKKIWNKTYLGKLLASDPVMGRAITIVLLLYICIHIFRLEMYPMYMFAMFSKQEVPRDSYHTYRIYTEDKEFNIKDLDFRKYTVLMNTINQFDDITSNNMIHPESEAIDKFVHRLHLENTGIKTGLKRSFAFDEKDLKNNLGIWFAEILKLKKAELRIEKEFYRWTGGSPLLYNKTIIYGVD